MLIEFAQVIVQHHDKSPILLNDQTKRVIIQKSLMHSPNYVGPFPSNGVGWAITSRSLPNAESFHFELNADGTTDVEIPTKPTDLHFILKVSN